jgi:hypothetical protein
MPIRTPLVIVHRAILLAFVSTCGIATAAYAPTPMIERSGDWRAAVRHFAVGNLKHPAWDVAVSLAIISFSLPRLPKRMLLHH